MKRQPLAPPAVIYLVRHAHAGQRLESTADDRLRALNQDGWRQAGFLAELLESEAVGDILSSPFTRCVETVEPLAARVGRHVMLTEILEEGRRIEPMLGLLDEVPDGSVLCTHGDMLKGAVERLGVIGAGERSLEKGSVWMLVRGRHGVTVFDVILPPPMLAAHSARPAFERGTRGRTVARRARVATTAHARGGKQ